MKHKDEYRKPQIEKNEIPKGLTFPAFEALMRVAKSMAFLFRKHDEFDKDEEVRE